MYQHGHERVTELMTVQLVSSYFHIFGPQNCHESWAAEENITPLIFLNFFVLVGLAKSRPILYLRSPLFVLV